MNCHDPAANAEITCASEEQLFSPSEVYHESSKIRPDDRRLRDTVMFVNSSPLVRNIISKPSASYRRGPVLALQAGGEGLAMPLGDALRKRRAEHRFSGQAMLREQLGRILWAGDGVTLQRQDSDGSQWSLRTAPSGGGLYSVEMYCAALRVEGLAQGLYHYNPVREELRLVRPGDRGGQLLEATYLEQEVGNAAAAVILTASMGRTKFKYGERAYRFALLECGHIAQNILLGAVATGAAALPVGGFQDTVIDGMIGLDGCEDISLYMMLLGMPES